MNQGQIVIDTFKRMNRHVTWRVGTKIALLLMIMFECLFHLCKAPRKNPWRYHISMLIIWSAISYNVVREGGEMMSAPELQLIFAIIIAFLNFLSVYEDKTRFSEGDCGMLGVDMTCRNFAKTASHIGLIFDAIGILIIIFAIFSKYKLRLSVFGFSFVICAIIVAMGTYFAWISIDNLMNDGSPSDLRGLTDEEARTKMRIAPDSVRGGLNAGITVLSIFAGMQGIVSHDKYFGIMPGKSLSLLGSAQIGFEYVVTIVPILLSIMNTRGQHEGGEGLGTPEIEKILPN